MKMRLRTSGSKLFDVFCLFFRSPEPPTRRKKCMPQGGSMPVTNRDRRDPPSLRRLQRIPRMMKNDEKHALNIYWCT